MSPVDVATPDGDEHLARRIATVLRGGTALSVVLLCLGAVLGALDLYPTLTHVTLVAGCGVVVLTPVLRIVLMAGHFARRRIWWLAVTSAAVLALVAVSALAGLLLPA